MWRGLMLNRAVQHFLEDVAWGDLDYLLIDMPPGTGDVQMGLARMLPRAEMIIVTTPAVSAQKVAIRAATMARKSYLRVVGVDREHEQRSAATTATSYALFGEGGGEALAHEAGVPLLGQIPIEPSVAAGGDAGEPIALGRGAGGRGLPGPRQPHRRRGRARRCPWPAARPACSTPPSPRSTRWIRERLSFTALRRAWRRGGRR